MICLISVLSLFVYAQAGLELCPSNLHRSMNLRQFGQSCYEFIFNHNGDWNHAQRDCKSRGGHLVSLGSNTEQAFIYNSLNVLHFHNDKGIWIGLTDQDREGNWRWESGEKVSYTHWAKGQPGLFGSYEDCALMEFRDGGLWHDYACHGVFFNTQNHGWVCEYGVVNILPANTTTSAVITSATTSKTISTTKPPSTILSARTSTLTDRMSTRPFTTALSSTERTTKSTSAISSTSKTTRAFSPTTTRLITSPTTQGSSKMTIPTSMDTASTDNVMHSSTPSSSTIVMSSLSSKLMTVITTSMNGVKTTQLDTTTIPLTVTTMVAFETRQTSTASQPQFETRRTTGPSARIYKENSSCVVLLSTRH